VVGGGGGFFLVLGCGGRLVWGVGVGGWGGVCWGVVGGVGVVGGGGMDWEVLFFRPHGRSEYAHLFFIRCVLLASSSSASDYKVLPLILQTSLGDSSTVPTPG